ncbi:MAG: tyrosine--tRNA ligase [Candidatus Paracaedimonas acanthamoebae]|uniref:Tyrosine--tRNA ligase n=1 Tax=Candidatus Paracaedimonas acanthamoebae TaxID=244581 RepID=A0A8J7TV75_9PROT|nr:tyrosine--tRNA ligase [Candidatus Paracaedimonas acanthamoebae]
MKPFSSEFLKESHARGFIHQGTDLEGLDQLLSSQTVIAYLGFDATAKSLHVGNLVQIMRLRLLQRSGHKPIVLMGGGTTRIGDPSGKDEMRQVLDETKIAENLESIKKIFAKYLTFGDGPTDAVMVNNADWLNSLNYLDFLRDYGRHFSINRMLTFDSVRQRLEREQSLSFLEFNYMILQAFDFLELHRRYGIKLQMGGADQWGNIISGVDLIRRLTQQEAFGLTSPLITTASGAKMGKTAQGAIWLEANLLSPYNFWQYWRNTADGDVGRFLRLFTDLPLTEIERLEKLKDAEINEAKKILADETTKLCHGENAVLEARKIAANLFENPEGNLSASAIPTILIDENLFSQGLPIYEALRLGGLAESNGEARRLIRGGGARIDDQPIENESLSLNLGDLKDKDYFKLSAGKKRHVLLKLQKA